MQVPRVAAGLLTADAKLGSLISTWVAASPTLRWVVSRAATWLAPLEVLLMASLVVTGGVGTAARMLAAVGAVYLASEGLGRAWPRQRPFARAASTQPLVAHAAMRSFPSRHVASAVAMATVARPRHPALAGVMSCVAALLGVARIAAGLHYPSDVLAGATLGAGLGRLLSGRASAAAVAARRHRRERSAHLAPAGR